MDKTNKNRAPHPKGQKISGKISNKNMKEKVFDLCDRLGFWNVHPLMIAKELGTAHQNVSRWKQAYIEEKGIPDIAKISKELNLNSQSALKELIKLMKDNNPKIRIAATSTYFDSVEKFTKFLENFNFKSKIADKVELKTDYTLAQAYEEYMKNDGKGNTNQNNKKPGC